MRSKATSFRLSEPTHTRLHERAGREGVAIRELLEQLIDEGIDAREHPGIVYRGRVGARRAGLAAGPDVWEVLDALRFTEGGGEQRIATAAERLDLHPRQVRIAVEFAATRHLEIDALIAENDAAARDARATAENRARYLSA